MLNVTIRTIPHEEHRYPTVGDYWDGHLGTKIIRVSEMCNEDYELLVAVHELIEQHLCKKRGIKEPDITAFDVKFEKERDEGKHPADAEPGFDPKAPYVKEHTFATKIEKLLAKELGVDWDTYDKTVMSLP